MRQIDIMLEFGQRVKVYRKAKGYSQEKLGALTNLTQTYISEVENGHRNISLVNMYLIAKALGIKVIDLVDFE
ncbi:helix-turn-helix domain-containing protein [Priestia koreensis]|uniref:helix-turn-helix domain-containing protein n=1 Tax=Priestia koreensis TaxID=284581 RepID=UPI001F560FC0|nr:helix-turn-helix transcriptional regulator [Priestia koreensis]UNL87505.1 helix-turn-helix transcriptional regulator [Priestia koreensis]